MYPFIGCFHPIINEYFLSDPRWGGGLRKKPSNTRLGSRSVLWPPPATTKQNHGKQCPFRAQTLSNSFMSKKKKKKATLVEGEGIGTRVPSERPSPSLRERLSLGFGRNIDGWRGGAVGSTQRCRGQARFRRREPGCVLARRTRPIYIYL